ncbi:MAG: class I SAM-dependent DNA methyltransferase [Thermoplasmata archaeon]
MTSAQKKRGAYFTPPQIAEYLAEWAIRSPNDSVLDPGAGDGAFLLAALDRLASLGGEGHDALIQICGIEIDSETAAAAIESLRNLADGGTPSVMTSDVFDVGPKDGDNAGLGYDIQLPRFDVVIGNPPYVRYHSFKGNKRKKALARARSLGVDLPALSSLWAPFLIHATTFVGETGRLAMVLPAELLTVDYGKNVRDHLLRHFDSVQLIVFEERVFPEVLEDVVLLLAEKSAQNALEFIRVQNVSSLIGSVEPVGVRRLKPAKAMGTKWTRFLLPKGIDETYEAVASGEGIATLGDVASVDIGVVTGRNDFFILSESEALEYQIGDGSLIPILTSSRNLHGLRFAKSDFTSMESLGKKCLLIDYQGQPDKMTDPGLNLYLEQGIANGIAHAYKCKGRNPWYAVPSVYMPDAFLSYMTSSHPKFAINDAGATCTNTVHRVRFNQSERSDPLSVATSWYNSLTMLSSELCGRSYGGGVLKHETKEAENIFIMRPDADTSKELRGVSDNVDSLLRSGNLEQAVQIVDEILLEGFLGISSRVLADLGEGTESLRSRRFSRMKHTPDPSSIAPKAKPGTSVTEGVEER